MNSRPISFYVRRPDAVKIADEALADGKDRYGPLWREIIHRRSGEPTTLTGVEPAVKWPGAMVSFSRGEIDRGGLLAAAAVDPASAAGNTCEAHFYMAEAAIIRGAVADAKPDLQVAIDTCPPAFTEAAAARGDDATQRRVAQRKRKALVPWQTAAASPQERRCLGVTPQELRATARIPSCTRAT